jgi:hypothetical protein
MGYPLTYISYPRNIHDLLSKKKTVIYRNVVRFYGKSLLVSLKNACTPQIKIMNNASKYSVKIIIVFLFFIIIHQKLQFNVNFSDLIDCSAPVAHRASNVFVKNLITKKN